jgi:hypothetical protein
MTYLVVGFERRTDAERLLEEWKDRLQKFGLELHPDKTRLIEFGRHAAEHRKQQGEGKPEVFNFLGFNHICGKTRKTGRFIVKRRLSPDGSRPSSVSLRQSCGDAGMSQSPRSGRG